MEEWNGCSRQLDKDEKICLLLEQWGGQARSVNLVMADAMQCELSPKKKRISSARTQAHGKVATRKQRSQYKDRLSKKALAKEVETLIKMVEKKQVELQSLTTPQQFLYPPLAVAGIDGGTGGEQDPYPQVCS